MFASLWMLFLSYLRLVKLSRSNDFVWPEIMYNDTSGFLLVALLLGYLETVQSGLLRLHRCLCGNQTTVVAYSELLLMMPFG